MHALRSATICAWTASAGLTAAAAFTTGDVHGALMPLDVLALTLAATFTAATAVTRHDAAFEQGYIAAVHDDMEDRKEAK
jgi:hypothetical protein